MKVTLREPPQYDSALRQVLHNRGIENIPNYLNAGMEDVSPPEALGEEVLKQGAKCLISHISAQDKILVVVDADCDGYTSSAILINYLYDLFPSFVEENLEWYIHESKQHGLSDCINVAQEYDMVILPDSSSNDYIFHKELKENNIDILILDHHEAEYISEDAIVINNQLSDYSNKELSGAGVTWQFCRYLDKINQTNYAQDYIDLVALGDMADMMSLRSVETKTLIFEGFKSKNIKNPFIYSMAEKNAFPLSKTDYKPSRYNNLQITPMGSAFFIAPFVNALVRSGEQEEKELIFESMLKFKAFEEISSNKRGHKQGEMEQLVTQAIRTCTNVKNRQTRAETAGLEHLESLIEENNMLEHKVLLFLLEPGEIDRNIAGLVANKFMAKYQRPVAILTEVQDEENGKISYQGSARGYDASGITNFKDICAEAPGCILAAGHQGAFGLGLESDKIDDFLDYTDEVLKDMSSEPSYFVDYIWNYDEIDGDKVLEIAEMNDYWGKDLDRALVLIKNIPVTSDSFKVMKSNTLKYICPVADIIQFRASDDQIEEFSTGSRKINAVCKAGVNEWNGAIDPQLLLVDYEVIEEEHNVITDWGF